MTRFREVSGRDWLATLLVLGLYVSALILGLLFLLPAFWYVWILLPVAGLPFLVRWHHRNFGYRCAACGHEFEISAWVDFISPHGIGGGGWKWLECPGCGRRTRATVLRKTDDG